MDTSEEWKHLVPGADQGFKLEIDTTTYRKFKLRLKRSVDLAYSIPLHTLPLRVALIDVYGARFLLTMEAHSAKLPFVAPPLAILDDHKKIELTYKSRHNLPRRAANSCTDVNCPAQKGNGPGLSTGHCGLGLTYRLGRCHGAPDTHPLAQSLWCFPVITV
jgi:hypothetical protein